MNRDCFLVFAACWVVVFSSRSIAGDNPLIGEWFPLENADSGLGGTRHFKTNGTVIGTFGFALHFKFQLRNQLPPHQDWQEHVGEQHGRLLSEVMRK